MDVFNLRNSLVDDYSSYVTSFINIADDRIKRKVDGELESGLLWPDPLIQLNPSFEAGAFIDDLVTDDTLHSKCSEIFRRKKDENPAGQPLQMYRHQQEAIQAAKTGGNYVLTTGTGSGKSMAYIVPIVDHVLRNGPAKGIQAIVVYPMNALANSQYGELEKFLKDGFPDGRGPVTFARYTGQDSQEARQEIWAKPPDILLTNYVMLELILTRPEDQPVVRGANGLKFLVLDELHTYRGCQGADVSMLVRRVRDLLNASDLQCVGTSATLAGGGRYSEQQKQVAAVAGQIFGSAIDPDNVIGETLTRSTRDFDPGDREFLDSLAKQISNPGWGPGTTYEDFVSQPLPRWLESTFGVTRSEENRLVRARPRSITGEQGAAQLLSGQTGASIERCEEGIKAGLLTGHQIEQPDAPAPVFAFRLHQFISGGDTVYATLEPEDDRYITVEGQQFKPGDRKILLSLVVCRECGQEYYSVRTEPHIETGHTQFIPRDLLDRLDDDNRKASFLYLSAENPWPDEDEALEQGRFPERWVEESLGAPRVRRNQRENLPAPVRLRPDGSPGDDGIRVWFITAPFQFCLNCGIEYHHTQRSDFAKLGSLSSERRNAATTVLSSKDRSLP